MGDAAHAMVPFYGQGMNAVSVQHGFSTMFVLEFYLFVIIGL